VREDSLQLNLEELGDERRREVQRKRLCGCIINTGAL
jgi:hypothetical protein